MIVDWDDAYANAAHIPGGDAYPPRWEAQAAAFRAGIGERLREGLPYGPHPRQRFDLFLPAGAPRGLLVFLHGGFWRAFDRGTWSHLAAGPIEAGWAVAMPGYVLAPEARIAAITAMVAGAIAAAAAEVPGPIRLCGHSAGGHLVTRQVCDDSRLPQDVAGRVDRVVSISGLHDLRPLLGTGMNAEALKLDPAEAAAESPALGLPRQGARVHVWVGDGERPEFVRQTTLLANVWTGVGADMEQTIEPRRHHFNVVEGLTHPGSSLLEAVVGDAWG
jgi:acetyl esterase/lipase